jgi:hypothetical protein
MKRTRPEPKIVLCLAPEARRILAGDAITGNSSVRDSRPDGTQDLNRKLCHHR